MYYNWRFAASSPKYTRHPTSMAEYRPDSTSRKRSPTDFYVPIAKASRSSSDVPTKVVVEIECLSDEEDGEQTGSTYEIRDDKLRVLAHAASGIHETFNSPSLISEASSYATAGSAAGNDALCDAMAILSLPDSFADSFANTTVESDKDVCSAVEESLKHIRRVAQKIQDQLSL
eukprot:6554692-Prymnesium_polylepis.1